MKEIIVSEAAIATSLLAFLGLAIGTAALLTLAPWRTRKRRDGRAGTPHALKMKVRRQ